MKRLHVMVSMLTLGVAVVGCNSSERKAGSEIIAKVEQFKKTNGHLPAALSDIGLEQNESCPCYCKTSNDSYIVWYGTTLGESETYDSRTSKWSEAAGVACAQ